MRGTSLAVAGFLLLACLAGLASAQIGGGIGNAAPIIQSVTIDDLDGTVAPNAGGDRSVVATTTVLDPNGFLDIAAATGATMALVFGGNDVIAEAAAPRTGGSLLTGTYARTFSVPYYFAPGTYTIRVEVEDLAGALDTDSSRTFTYSTLLASDPGDTIDLGSSLDPGETGGIVPLSVQNTGNAVIDVQVVADGDLEHETLDAAIPIGSVDYGVDAGLADAAAMVSSSPPTLTAFSLAVATSGGASSKDLHFRLNVPDIEDLPEAFLPAGDYETDFTVTAVANS